MRGSILSTVSEVVSLCPLRMATNTLGTARSTSELTLPNGKRTSGTITTVITTVVTVRTSVSVSQRDILQTKLWSILPVTCCLLVFQFAVPAVLPSLSLTQLSTTAPPPPVKSVTTPQIFSVLSVIAPMVNLPRLVHDST